MEIATQKGKRWLKTPSGVKVVQINPTKKSPFEMREPNWVSDHEVDRCQDCYVLFSLTNRRHHCRRCGKIFCDKCCGYYFSIPRMGFIDPVRNCRKCAIVTRNERDFFEKDIRVLRGGAHVTVWQQERPSSVQGLTSQNPSDTVPVVCALDDERWILDISPGSCDYQFIDIPLSSIKGYFTEGQVRDAFTGSSVLTVQFMDGDILLETKFRPCEPPYKQVALKWLTSLQTALDTLTVKRHDSPREEKKYELPGHFI